MPTQDQEPGRTIGRRRVRKVTEVVSDEAAARADVQVKRALPGAKTVLWERGIRTRDITVFLRQLILLLEAGTPILKSLQTLTRRGERPGGAPTRERHLRVR